MNNESNAVMILGCGRSGTSIFGELFDGLAGYTYESEPPFSSVKSADFSAPLAFKVPRESKKYPAQPGLSFPLDALFRVAPNVRFFWIVRHPLDAICSLKVGIANNWGHHPRPPNWQHWIDRPITEQCAYHWLYLNSAGFRQVESIAKLVRFEDMIADPTGFAETVCRHAGIAINHSGEQVEAWARRVQNSNNELFVEATTSRNYSRNDHTVRVSRWHENLRDEEARHLWEMVKETAEPFGYDGP